MRNHEVKGKVVSQHFHWVALLDIDIAATATGSECTLELRGHGPPDAEQLWSVMLRTLATVLADLDSRAIGKPAN